jgi:hypothetical protein
VTLAVHCKGDVGLVVAVLYDGLCGWRGEGRGRQRFERDNAQRHQQYPTWCMSMSKVHLGHTYHNNNTYRSIHFLGTIE